MSNWLANALQQAGQIDDWLAPQRQAAVAQLQQSRWPNRKTEAWKYTSLHALENARFAEPAASTASIEPIDGLAAIELHFINGRLQALPGQLPAGLEIASLEQAGPQQREQAQALFAGIKPQRHLFGLVNDALAQQGVLIRINDDCSIEQPIRIVQHFSDACQAHSRVLVDAGRHARFCLVEQFSGDAASCLTAFSEIRLAEHASCEHYRLMLQGADSITLGGCHVQLADHAALDSTLVAFGSTISRLDMDVIHAGQHANARLNAVYLLDGKELFDLHSCIEHASAHGTTEENVRGIVAGSGHAVFNGRIHIHRGAQKTLAELNNANLLLSRQAEVDTKPELEIYADDVRCAHGATVAEVDKKALYYLQSRGIALADARVMLSFGFINELVDAMPNQALADWLRPQLRQRFAAMSSNG